LPCLERYPDHDPEAHPQKKSDVIHLSLPLYID
jgi:hypothetical protein